MIWKALQNFTVHQEGSPIHFVLSEGLPVIQSPYTVYYVVVYQKLFRMT